MIGAAGAGVTVTCAMQYAKPYGLVATPEYVVDVLGVII